MEIYKVDVVVERDGETVMHMTRLFTSKMKALDYARMHSADNLNSNKHDRGLDITINVTMLVDSEGVLVFEDSAVFWSWYVEDDAPRSFEGTCGLLTSI